MPYCTKCGIPIDGDGNLCASCTSSSKLKDAAKDPIEKIADGFNAAEDHTKSFEEKDISKNKGLGVLAYLGILFCIPYFIGEKPGFIRFHAKQGMILFVFELLVNVVMLLLRTIFGWIRILSFLFAFIHAMLGFVILAFIAIGISNVLQGKAKELPFLGKFAYKL